MQNILCRLIFKKQLAEPKTEDIDNTGTNDTCKVAFIMHKDGDIEIDLDWPNDIDDIKNAASNYAALISVINYGGFKEDIKKLLLDVKSEYSTDKSSETYQFISHTLNRISEAQQITELNSDKPIIGPRQVFIYNSNK